ncbi:hypothetical protein ACIPW9_36145 [Streptomyces sp. NPDC090052]|uniref:hypothetical protein n=1 Tax=Streptomyces sp. NPDC090052 TaxID=3365931 RepID=UPI0038250A41
MTDMARLVTTVYVQDPDRHRTVVLAAGEEPEQRLAALITNPACWENGKLPTANSGAEATGTADDQSTDDKPTGEASEDTKPAAKKAATRPARGRKTADTGDGGQ